MMVGRLVAVDLETWVALGGVTRRGRPPESRAAYRAPVDAWLDAVMVSWAHYPICAALSVPSDQSATTPRRLAQRQFLLHLARQSELAEA